MDVIYFGAGCFWCVEAVFERLNGVSDVVSGYMGGHVKNPAYREVCNGTTGHAEVVKIEYVPEIISFEDLLRIFWTTHDPTTLNRQGADKGTQYRSAIFYTTEMQRVASLESKSRFATEMWQDPIVTEIKQAGDFYTAENYHQDYYTNNPDQGYCSIVIPPKIAKLRASFSHLIKK
jgi:peptide-methionine (S)-S-oxide reductase